MNLTRVLGRSPIGRLKVVCHRVCVIGDQGEERWSSDDVEKSVEASAQEE